MTNATAIAVHVVCACAYGAARLTDTLRVRVASLKEIRQFPLVGKPA
jgi:hypothetical protein